MQMLLLRYLLQTELHNVLSKEMKESQKAIKFTQKKTNETHKSQKKAKH